MSIGKKFEYFFSDLFISIGKEIEQIVFDLFMSIGIYFIATFEWQLILIGNAT